MDFIWQITRQDLEQVEILKDQLEGFRVKLSKWDRVSNRKEFFANMDEFLKFVWSFKNDRIFHIFKHTEHYSVLKDFFSFLTTYYLRTIQIMESLEIWKKIKKWESYYDYFKSDYLKRVYDQTKREMKKIDLSKCNTALVIDTWALSPTIFGIYENTNVKNVIWVSKSEESTYMAEEAIKSQKTNRMRFRYCDWRHCIYAWIDLLYITNFTINKKAILDKIAENCNDNIRVVIKIPRSLWSMIYEDPTIWLHPRLYVDSVLSDDWHLYKTVILKKLNF